MVPDPGEIVAAWPFAASLAAAASARGLREARRRTALNEALHELRRPLQVLALSASGDGPAVAGGAADGARPPGGREQIDGALRMAAAALERLEREINGEAVAPARGPVAARPLLEAAVARWKGRAADSGDTLRLRWRAGDAVLAADEAEIAQAVDNLIVNAIEHGGPRIEVEGRLLAGGLRVLVRDSGPRPPAARGRRGKESSGFPGRRRHGHGLRVVRRVATGHGGRFELRRSKAGTEAVLELPLLGAGEDA